MSEPPNIYAAPHAVRLMFQETSKEKDLCYLIIILYLLGGNVPVSSEFGNGSEHSNWFLSTSTLFLSNCEIGKSPLVRYHRQNLVSINVPVCTHFQCLFCINWRARICIVHCTIFTGIFQAVKKG
jgi:hypothetical protein